MRRDDERFYSLVEIILAHMSEGGIYDHLGGGFSRYAVDEKWLVPHSKKCCTIMRNCSNFWFLPTSAPAGRYTATVPNKPFNGSPAK